MFSVFARIASAKSLVPNRVIITSVLCTYRGSICIISAFILSIEKNLFLLQNKIEQNRPNL